MVVLLKMWSLSNYRISLKLVRKLKASLWVQFIPNATNGKNVKEKKFVVALIFYSTFFGEGY